MQEYQAIAVRKAARMIRTYHAVAIVGAGLSWARGLPLAPELFPLVWHAIDADHRAGEQLAARFNTTRAEAKTLIGEDPERIEAAFAVIEANKHARLTFQTTFARLDANRAQQPSPAHDGLVELLHRRFVDFVVSFNWDTLLEAAYRRRYGSSLGEMEGWLIKPHGDAASPETPWILPHQAGNVPQSLIQQLNDCVTDGPRVLLIVGYSERDPAVNEMLFGPLSGKWQVCRISPSASGELSVNLPADQAIPALLEDLSERSGETPGWQYVSFEHQRKSLARALLGERLGPGDVVACAQFPEVSLLKRQLRATGAVAIVGESGTGKSITAYQAAFDFSKQGWEILRLVDPKMEPERLLAAHAAP